MRALLFFILLFSGFCSFIVQAQTQQPQIQQSQTQQPQVQQPQVQQSQAQQTQSQQTQQSQSQASQASQAQTQQKKGLVESILTPSAEEKNGDDKDKKSERLKVLKEKAVDVDQLQEIIDDLPEQDRRIISAIKVQISTWPREIFDEISAYREFVISSRKFAKQKYELLSPEAKSALEAEKQLKEKLSPETANILESLEVKTGE